MATLVSPGVSISVTDESFYASAGTGTVPLIVIATAQDKNSPDGAGAAAYTTAATAGTVQLITSQRDLLTNYGNPIFKTRGGTPLHGHELNEYGLMTAYSFLGIANRAYILRANVDLDELNASAIPPTPAPANGTYWLDILSTVLGLKRWDGVTWIRQSVKIPVAADMATDNTPKASYGINGEFAAAYFADDGSTLADIKLYHKISGAWYHIGSASWDSASGRNFYVASHATLPSSGLSVGDMLLQYNSPNNGTDLSIKIYNSLTGQFVTESYVISNYSRLAYILLGRPAVDGDLWAKIVTENGFNPQATIVIKRHNGGSSVVAQSSSALSDTAISLAGHSNTAISFNIIVNNIDSPNSTVKVSLVTDSDSDGSASVDDIVGDINQAISVALPFNSALGTVVASNVSGKVTVTCTSGKDILFTAGNVSGFTPGNLNITADVPYSNWEDLSYEASATPVIGNLADGTLWYDNVVSADNIDILYNSGNAWSSYPGDVQVSAVAPTKKGDGTTALVSGDLWIDSSDLENYPVIRKYSGSTWVLVDNTDQVTSDGIVFADARVSKTSAIDADALIEVPFNQYPAGTMLWNKRASGGNVKRWTVNHSVSGILIGDRWVDASGNKSDGSPYMLRKAQRRMVVQALQSAMLSNEDIRNEVNRFNLIVVPGYPELLDEMISLNIDRKETAFILVDPPLRLSPSGTSLQAWINNSGNANENGEAGLISTSPYVGVYYPHALTTNLDGTSVLQPASHIALRTLAFNDQVAFPWFAPAGFQRGLVTNATNVGYLDATTAEFRSVALSEGQRDTLYVNKVNPISNFPGRGLVVFGQKTLNPVSSALDRVNVARLVVYIRERLDDIVKPFLFEPNDEVTRQNAKVVIDRFLGQLVVQRGLFDFLTVCDTSNNTPARIDRNELHIDIAIQPVKAVEFIYIPIRIQNTLGQTA
jgi:hypothetical protein